LGIKGGLDGISFLQTGCGLKNEGEDARLYAAVESCSNFAIELGSIFQQEKTLSMKQNIQMKK
jgi:phosphoribosylformylglycinamidine synthase